MSNRVITMYLGRIVEESPADEVTDGARHPYTRALFGDAGPAGPDRADPAGGTGSLGAPSLVRLPVLHALLEGDRGMRGSDAGVTATSIPGHRLRCHHPVEEGRATRELVAQVVAAVPEVQKSL